MLDSGEITIFHEDSPFLAGSCWGASMGREDEGSLVQEVRAA